MMTGWERRALEAEEQLRPLRRYVMFLAARDGFDNLPDFVQQALSFPPPPPEGLDWQDPSPDECRWGPDPTHHQPLRFP